MARKIRVGLLFGGRSGEHEVSLMSARSVLKAINKDKYDVTLIGITKEGKWIGGENPVKALESGEIATAPATALLGEPQFRALMQVTEQPGSRAVTLSSVAELDVIFPVLHGTFGEDGTVQGLLELTGIPYVGAGVAGSAVGMDKGLFKGLMQANQIPVPKWLVVTRSEVERDLQSITVKAEELGKAAGFGPYPLFTKPANLGSSVGVVKAHNRVELETALQESARWDRRILVEQGVNAREIEVSVLGNDDPVASVPGEIIPGHEFYDYEAKYIDESSQLIIPAPVSPEVAKRAQQLAIAAFKAIDCAGMARVDFLLDRESGELYVNELNTIPGFTQISMYPKLWEASGLSYSALIDRLLELALERQAEKDRIERIFEVKK